MNSELKAEQQASWQRLLSFVFGSEPKLCEKEAKGVDTTAKLTNLTECYTGFQTKLYTGNNENSQVNTK